MSTTDILDDYETRRSEAISDAYRRLVLRDAERQREEEQRRPPPRYPPGKPEPYKTNFIPTFRTYGQEY